MLLIVRLEDMFIMSFKFNTTYHRGLLDKGTLGSFVDPHPNLKIITDVSVTSYNQTGIDVPKPQQPHPSKYP